MKKKLGLKFMWGQQNDFFGKPILVANNQCGCLLPIQDTLWMGSIFINPWLLACGFRGTAPYPPCKKQWLASFWFPSEEQPKKEFPRKAPPDPDLMAFYLWTLSFWGTGRIVRIGPTNSDSRFAEGSLQQPSYVFIFGRRNHSI